MATTGFWPVKGKLKDVLDYADNPDKTTDKKFLDEDLWNVLQYTESDQKTDQRMYVSGINCAPQRAYEAMMDTKRKYGKLGGNVAYHGYQSFREGEVTPEEAHQIGLETARRMWGSEYEILVTTHLNTENVHNHIVVNSVSFRTGRKFENHISDHFKLREISDEICRERGKSVLENAPFFGGEKDGYWVRKNGGLTHRDMLRGDLEEALAVCSSHRDLERYLRGLGYRFERDFRYEHPSLILDSWKKPVRIDSLGERYSVDSIRERILRNQRKPELYYIAIPDRNRMPMFNMAKELQKLKKMGFVAALFTIFLELLGCSIDRDAENKKRPMSPELRAEVAKLDKYIAQQDLLLHNKIGTAEELIAYRDKLTGQINELDGKRKAIRNRIRRAKTPEEQEELKNQAKYITKKMQPLRKQRQLTIDILVKSIPRMEELLEYESKIEERTLRRIRTQDRGR